MGSAVVVGAGIAGLACAAALDRRGWAIQVVEREPTLAAVGAGIVLQPNARRVLQAIDAEPEGLEFDTFTLADRSGRALIAQRVGPSLAATREALHGALASRVAHLPLHLGASASLAPGGVRLDDGRVIEAEHVIAADGLASTIRHALAPEVRRVYSGYTCLRALLDLPDPPARPVECWGRGARVGVVPLVRGVYVYVTFDAPPRSSVGADTMARVRFGFGGLPARVLDALPAEPMHHDIDELDRHVFERDGAWFVGDAAHGSTPNLGQGAAQGLEDALSLAQALTGEGRPYARRRRGRAWRVALASRWVGRVGQWSGPVAAGLRDASMRALGRATASSS